MTSGARRLRMVLPRYATTAAEWKRSIHAAALAASVDQEVRFLAGEPLAVEIVLHMRGGLARRDVDNRVKQVLDAIQGRLGNGGKVPGLVLDDNQVFRIVAETRRLPADLPKTHGGWLTVTIHDDGSSTTGAGARDE